MSLYFFLHDAAFFDQEVIPTLASCWRQRSFTSCQPLAAALETAVQEFSQRFHTGPRETLLSRVGSNLPFDRDIWRHLAGEILLYGARDIPEIRTAPETLLCLLAPDLQGKNPVPHERFAPIQQAYFGTRDLVFGAGYYRPDKAGWNDRADVERLAAYLAAIDPGQWQSAALVPLENLEEEDRAEELEYARECFQDLRDLYQEARRQDGVVVSEIIS